MRRSVVLALFSLLSLAGCGRSEDEPGNPGNELAKPDASTATPLAFRAADASKPAQEAGAARRYMAVRHDLHIQTEAEGVEPAWRRANEACEAAGCDLLSSSITRDERYRPATGQLEARVPPDKLDAFLKQVSALGSVSQHSRNAEDKTDEVIDTEAQLKNQSEFRDNLRHLLAKPGAKLSDLIDVERELARVQGELDSLASRRKALASLTDKVRVTLTITARPEAITSAVWTPVRDAATGAGRVLARSLAGLITFVVAVLPWTLVMLCVGWIVRKLWRRRQARKAAVVADVS